MGLFRAHVEEEFEAAHANGPEGHKCNTMHGHTWLAEVEFTYVELDESGWGPDFGLIKALIKPLDHNNLNEYFGPGGLAWSALDERLEQGMRASAENIARWLFDLVNLEVTARGGVMNFVRVSEGGGNRVTYYENAL
jgi:6-pyruvoyl-tetrahydropterin synthase